jgi:hypothetical protein
LWGADGAPFLLERDVGLDPKIQIATFEKNQKAPITTEAFELSRQRQKPASGAEAQVFVKSEGHA